MARTGSYDIMSIMEHKVLQQYKKNPLLADIVSNYLALFILGLLYETGPKNLGALSKDVSSVSVSAFGESIALLLKAQLISESDEEITITELGEKYLARLGLLRKVSLERKKRVRVLVVDDMEIMRDFLRSILDSRHVQCDVACNGLEAMELLRKYRYEVVFLDIKMPDISGIEVLEFIARSYPDTKAIMVTGYPSPEYVSRSFQFGAVDFIEKPFDTDRLLDSFDHVLTLNKN